MVFSQILDGDRSYLIEGKASDVNLENLDEDFCIQDRNVLANLFVELGKWKDYLGIVEVEFGSLTGRSRNLGRD